MKIRIPIFQIPISRTRNFLSSSSSILQPYSHFTNSPTRLLRAHSTVLSRSHSKSSRTRAMALTRSEEPLVWIDCEMTGLSPSTDQILSLSCFLTTSTLHPIEPQGYHAIISHPASVLSSMGPWCHSTHTKSGLIEQCLSSTTTPETASSELLSYIRTHIPTPRTALLAGNTIHMDRAFLMAEPWGKVLEYLHYRVLDVSSIKEAVRRWVGDTKVLEKCPRKEGRHEAKKDIEESIEEARYYMGLFRGLGKEQGEEEEEGKWEGG